jgi:hypothetical protein
MMTELTDVEIALQKEFEVLQKEFDKESKKIIFSAATKEFIIFNYGTIICPLNIKDGILKPTLTINRNKVTEQICKEFQTSTLYQNEEGKQIGSLEYTFTDDCEKIRCMITDFTGVEKDTPDISRIIHFKQTSKDNLPFQWAEINNPVTVILNDVQKVRPKVIDTILWSTCMETGFIVNYINKFEKCLILSINSLGRTEFFNLVEEDTIDNIISVWPELEIKKIYVDRGVFLSNCLVLSLNTSSFPLLDNGGVFKFTRHHSQSTVKCVRTHTNCC